MCSRLLFLLISKGQNHIFRKATLGTKVCVRTWLSITLVCPQKIPSVQKLKQVKLPEQNQHPPSWDNKWICLFGKNWTWHTRMKADFHHCVCEHLSHEQLALSWAYVRSVISQSGISSIALCLNSDHLCCCHIKAQHEIQRINQNSEYSTIDPHLIVNWVENVKTPPSSSSPRLSMLTLPKLWTARVGT